MDGIARAKGAPPARGMTCLAASRPLARRPAHRFLARRPGRMSAARRVAIYLVLALLLSACAVAPARASLTAAGDRPARGPRCDQVRIPVTLSAGSAVTYHMAGWLCADGSPRGRTVEVLIPGLTYGASYWNFPLDPERYSYVRAATAAGFATLAIDRLGEGASDYPPATDVTATTESYALHQIVTALHAGRIGHAAFGKVVLVGHSYGSDLALREAAAYADVSGVISTGWLTTGNLAGHLRVRDSYDTSAAQDAKFASASLPAGYVTTKPGTRGADFYNTSYASAAVIAEDETLKQTVSAGELASVTVEVPQAATLSIHVPVLIADGQDDNLNCDNSVPALSCASSADILAREGANYSPQACLQAFVLPEAGHSINLHPDAPEWFAAASQWVRHYVDGARPGRCARAG